MSSSICRPETPLELRNAIGAWFDTPLGLALQAREAAALREVLPQLFGACALQLGRPGRIDLLDASAVPRRFVIDVAASPGAQLSALPEALPFEHKSIDLALLPHTLDFAIDPHQVVREVHRVLTPEGHAVILGFNPWSLWGLWRLWYRGRGVVPWCGHFLALTRIKDWLTLLDFEIVQGSLLFYRPPLQHERSMERLQFMERTGDRWWPLGAGAYLLVAKKRVPGLTPLRLSGQRKRLMGRPLTQPVTRA